MTAADNNGRHERPAGWARARRLLVALDTSRESLAALEAAADLAARMRIELQGLFIEDTDLLDLASDPLVRSFDAATGRVQEFSADAMERSLRRQIIEARRAFEAATNRRKVRGSFEVRRGRAAAEIVGQSTAGDLIVVTRTASSAEFFPIRAKGGAGGRTGAVARALVSQSIRPVLILNPGARAEGKVFVAFDGSPAAHTAVAAACEIADRRGGHEIGVLLVAADDAAADEMRKEVTELLADQGHAGVFERLLDTALETMCASVSQENAALLVLGVEQPFLAEKGAEAVLDQVSCSVLLVR